MSTYAVVNPATGEKVKEYPEIGDAELRAAIDRADEASRTWSRSSTVAERAALVRKVGELHGERRQQLAEIIVREMGKPIEQALMEVDFAGEIYGYYADNAEALMADEPIELLGGEGTALVRRSPFGVLLGIMPWNFPYYQVARFAGPNLVIGNPILLKHAPQCPESAEAMAQMFSDAGFPAGAYENIYATQRADRVGDRRPAPARRLRHRLRARRRRRRRDRRAQPEEGRARARRLGPVHPARDATTSTRPWRRPPKRGSTTPASPATPPSASSSSTTSTTSSSRSSPRRWPRRSRATRPPRTPLSARSPREAAADRLEEQVKRAVEDGAEVVVGGKRDGNYFEPTILTGIEPGDEASQEEFFGPVAQVYRVGSEEEAVALANQTPFGLGSYVMTTDKEQGERVADKIEAGMVYVNLVGADSPELPFGGFKRSGFGRELGRFGADEFVNKKLIRSA